MNNIHTVVVEARTSPLEIKEVKLQAWCLGMLKNASLQTMRSRIYQMKRNPAWRAMGAWKPKNQEEKQARVLAYKLLYREYSISDSECIKVVQNHWRESGWMPDHVDGRMCNRLGAELWEDLEKWLFAKAGQPRYKPSQERSSVLGNDKRSGLRYQNGRHYHPGRVFERTGRMQHAKGPLKDKELEIRTDWSKMPKNRAQYYLAQQDKVKQTKLVLAEKPNKKLPKVEVHLTFDCPPYRSKEYLNEVENGQKAKAGLISMDFGPQGAAFVDDQGSWGFVMPEDSLRKEIKRLRHKRKSLEQSMDKSRREMNKSAYESKAKGKHAKGKFIKGNKASNKSKEQLEREKRRRNIYREETKLVNQYHRNAIRRVVKLASNLVTEKDSIKEWKEGGYGKNIQTYVTGRLKTLLMREFAILGGWVHEHDPYITKLSSYCLCGNRVKKDVKQRVHKCQNPKCKLYGHELHRDLFSAYLGLLVKQHGLSNLIKGKLITEHWTAALEICSKGSVVALEAPEKGKASKVGPVSGEKATLLASGGEDSSSRPRKASRVNDSRLLGSKPILMDSSKDPIGEDREGEPHKGKDRQNAGYIDSRQLE